MFSFTKIRPVSVVLAQFQKIVDELEQIAIDRALEYTEAVAKANAANDEGSKASIVAAKLHALLSVD